MMTSVLSLMITTILLTSQGVSAMTSVTSLSMTTSSDLVASVVSSKSMMTSSDLVTSEVQDFSTAAAEADKSEQTTQTQVILTEPISLSFTSFADSSTPEMYTSALASMSESLASTGVDSSLLHDRSDTVTPMAALLTDSISPLTLPVSEASSLQPESVITTAIVPSLFSITLPSQSVALTTLADMSPSSLDMSLLPVSSATLTIPTTPRVTTTSKPQPTTTLDPRIALKCKDKLAPTYTNAHFEVLVTNDLGLSMLMYNCNEGFRKASGHSMVQCTNNGWRTREATQLSANIPLDGLVCEPIVFDKPTRSTPPPPSAPPPYTAPEWLDPMVTAAAVLLASLILFTLMLLVFVKCSAHQAQVTPWQADDYTEDIQPPVKKGESRRGWPWKRPYQRPLGHVGADGVAIMMNADS